MCKVQGVDAELVQSSDSDLPFRVGWEKILSKYFKRLPAGFTSNYFFEFCDGLVTYRHLITTPDAQAVTFRLVDDPVATRKLIINELFRVRLLKSAELVKMRLSPNPGIILKKSKLKSLSKKYMSIPKQFRSYYPSIEDLTDDEGSEEGKEIVPNKVKKRKFKQKLAPGVPTKRRKPGRPMKCSAPVDTPSSLSYFKLE